MREVISMVGFTILVIIFSVALLREIAFTIDFITTTTTTTVWEITTIPRGQGL